MAASVLLCDDFKVTTSWKDGTTRPFKGIFDESYAKTPVGMQKAQKMLQDKATRYLMAPKLGRKIAV
jgi:hypothetical protein